MYFADDRSGTVIRRTAAMFVASAAVLAATLALDAPAWAAGGDRPVTTTATARIQGLLDHPVNGTVNLPPGTFTIRPALRLQRGVRVAGHHTTLKVAPGSGNYRAMLSGATPATDLSGLTITGIRFDQNTRGNPVFSTSSLFRGKPRFVILVSAGLGITVTGNRFIGIDGVNSVVAGGGTRNVTISGNVFRAANIRGHDHSSIYTSGTRTVIRNNTLTGTAMYSSAAIEVHGNWVNVTGNHVAGYPRAANIVASHTNFSHNKVVSALNPVDLWSVQPPGLTHVAVTANTLGRNQRYWARVYRQHGRSLPPARYNRKVIRDESSTYPMHDITVRNNRS